MLLISASQIVTANQVQSGKSQLISFPLSKNILAKGRFSFFKVGHAHHSGKTVLSRPIWKVISRQQSGPYIPTRLTHHPFIVTRSAPYRHPPITQKQPLIKRANAFLFSLFSGNFAVDLNCDQTAGAFLILPFSRKVVTKALNKLSCHNKHPIDSFWFPPQIYDIQETRRCSPFSHSSASCVWESFFF